MTEIQTNATPQPPSPPALRMRRARARRREGTVLVSLHVGSDAAAAFVALGWLGEQSRGDKGAITRALIDLYSRAIQTRVIPSTTSQDQLCFMIELDPRAISGLVELGWLGGSRRHDRAAVLDGFGRFVRYTLVTQNTGR